MKFTTTENKSYRGALGYVPKNWIDCGDTEYKDAIWKYFRDHIMIWDFDECGDETHDFLFDDGKAYRLTYSWWAEWFHEDEDENGLKYETVIDEISADEANVPTTAERDWI